MTKANNQIREKAKILIALLNFDRITTYELEKEIEQALLEAKEEGRQECENKHIIKTVTVCSHKKELCSKCLLEEREKAIRECIDVAASHRSGDGKYMWKACSAEIVEELQKLLPSREKEGKK